MEFKDFEEFIDDDNGFNGMVADFSNGQKLGFEDGLESHYDITQSDYNIEELYQFCHVHFKRSLTRISHNHAVIPMQQKDDFEFHVLELTKETVSKEDFHEKVEQNLKEYKPSKKWLDLYLHPKRAPCIFLAL